MLLLNVVFLLKRKVIESEVNGKESLNRFVLLIFVSLISLGYKCGFIKGVKLIVDVFFFFLG